MHLHSPGRHLQRQAPAAAPMDAALDGEAVKVLPSAVNSFFFHDRVSNTSYTYGIVIDWHFSNLTVS